MIIKVLGPGCDKCKSLVDSINVAVNEAGVAAVVERVEDNKEIEKYKVKGIPALVIDEKVVSAGKQLSAQEVKGLF
ncbi:MULTISPECIES: thioredoxin family protein [unclassified Bacillus (in: firmicutes)]|uniref:thioredoxin family protein n=1 Tax=unclassified Bacillus (in: firmicutes) TaxID=185979 RepID=UPI001BE80B70|nr:MULTISPECIES: thioredoxin family protein [unclassified Bacillus (in: firmicutes)]MBT2640271.1 thioredoxin family protein [Bacillus sp. ISL-39]MBT2662680.1 thioredoxin family protein [Bacillus sp. ISL-45]